MIAKAVAPRSGTRTFAIGVEYITEHSHQRALVAVGGGFESGVTYIGAPQKAAWVQLRGVASVETAAIEMEATAMLSTRCADPVYHLIVAYAKNEHPTRAEVVSDAERLLAALHMEDHQYVLSAHQDTDDFHAHVIANRIGPDGRANDLWHERIIRERVCAEIAAERGWEIVVGNHNRDIVQRMEDLHAMPERPARRLDDREYRQLHERGELPWAELARPYILDAVDRATDWSDLHRRLDAHGVVVKQVQRGSRIQGLAFAEGLDERAPGCAASRIDARCAMSALEGRFGAFVPAREIARDGALPEARTSQASVEDTARSPQWSDTVRALILAEVDAAASWSELAARLGRHGIVIKVVERGGRVQGLAFAQGEHGDAPGCGASRIDARCKKASLEERFGPCPFTPGEHARFEERTESARERKAERVRDACERQRAERQNAGGTRERGRMRERAEQRASDGAERVLHEAERIVDHTRMRSAYQAYRGEYFAERRRAGGERHTSAWERERAQRQTEAEKRRETRLLLRAVARIARGPVRQFAYWAIDAMMDRRRVREYTAARERWDAAKAGVSAERFGKREEKPMDYHSFVAERARKGDASAKRVHDDLTQTMRAKEARPPHEEQRQAAAPPTMTVEKARVRLDEIHATETARYERVRRERDTLVPVEEPCEILQELHERHEALREEVAEAIFNSDAVRLKAIVERKNSWNPLIRAAASKEEQALHADQQRSHATAIRDALQRFDEQEAPVLTERFQEQERLYDAYVAKSYELEEQMNDALGMVRQELPLYQGELAVIERAGVSRIEGLREGATLGEIEQAIHRCYTGIPEATRRTIEQQLRRERKSMNRTRDALSMDE